MGGGTHDASADRDRLRGPGDEPDGIARNYEKHLATTVQEAVKTLSLRTIGGSQVVQVQIAEIKGLVSL
jgi:hypothetical protein